MEGDPKTSPYGCKTLNTTCTLSLHIQVCMWLLYIKTDEVTIAHKYVKSPALRDMAVHPNVHVAAVHQEQGSDNFTSTSRVRG